MSGFVRGPSGVPHQLPTNYSTRTDEESAMNRTNIIALPQARVRRAIECPWCDVWALRADSADNRLELAQHQVSRHPSHVFGAS